MGMGPRANLYSIGDDPLTQLNCLFFLFFFIFHSSKETLSEKINGKYVVGDPLTQLKLIQ